MDIALMPSIDLHTGYHGALIDSPPPDVSVRPQAARHVFLHEASSEFSPHRDVHCGEFIAAPPGYKVVHSSRWPVLGCRGWVADTDDLMYPIMCGRTAHSQQFRKQLRSVHSSEFRRTLRARCQNIIAAYTHPSCTGRLFRGHPHDGLTQAIDWLDRLEVHAPQEFFRKLVPIRPAQPALEAQAFEAKWQTSDLEVVFCGRDFSYKNGLLALNVMRQILDAHPHVRFTYIGPIPDSVRNSAPELIKRIDHKPTLERRDVLTVLRKAHILFHPSKGDSIGISLLEAMGAGLAVVVASGGAMEYSGELFKTGGALLLERGRIKPEEEHLVFYNLLVQLVTNPTLARAHAARNLEQTSVGEYSIQVQQRRLLELYALAKGSGAPPLQLADLPHTAGLAVSHLSSAEVWADMREARKQAREAMGYQCILV